MQQLLLQMENIISGRDILVTGGAGAIGNWMVKVLAKNNEVTVLDNFSSGHKSNIKDLAKVRVIHDDLIHDECLKKTFDRRYDLIFHLAANFANQNSVENPQKDLLINGLGTLRLLEHAKISNSGRFIYSSSSCVYGNSAGAIPESAKASLLDTPYAISKLLGEQYCDYFKATFNLDTVVLRYFNSFGPGEFPGAFRNVIPNFLALAMKGEPLLITGDGTETRDFNFVLNTVLGTLLAGVKPDIAGSCFNIGSGISVSISELANKINELTGNKSGLKYIQRRHWDHIDHRRADISRSKELIQYSPTISLDEGLIHTYEWFKQNCVTS